MNKLIGIGTNDTIRVFVTTERTYPCGRIHMAAPEIDLTPAGLRSFAEGCVGVAKAIERRPQGDRQRSKDMSKTLALDDLWPECADLCKNDMARRALADLAWQAGHDTAHAESQAEIARLREAMEFYAKKSNYTNRAARLGGWRKSKIDLDGKGDVARAALEGEPK